MSEGDMAPGSGAIAAQEKKTDNQAGLLKKEVEKVVPQMSASMLALQSQEEGLILDTVAEIRKCGLESILSLPQLVVCGDQSAGKSSVLEALTEIPFPRNDNLCTRYVTEIIMRRAEVDSLSVKVIPDEERVASEKARIQSFAGKITDFADLPSLMEKANEVMGVGPNKNGFSRDVLSITIEGPKRPQLTLVDLPGLIQNATKDTKESDPELVEQLTDRYISQPRTICLAVVTGAHDYANQRIIKKVKRADLGGNRTLGIITKPDRIEKDSATEKSFIELAQNKDINFKHGWHVLRNRESKSINSSTLERNMVEDTYFRTSNFKVLAKGQCGIETLRKRLANLLFNHVKKELPKLRDDLEETLSASKEKLESLGKPRATADQCRQFLTESSADVQKIVEAAIDGRYSHSFFNVGTNEEFTSDSPGAIRRLRALVQMLNNEFANGIHHRGMRYRILWPDKRSGDDETETSPPDVENDLEAPEVVDYDWAIDWVKKAMEHSRFRELHGNFNPLIIGELFWEMSAKWTKFAAEHLEEVDTRCSAFFDDVLNRSCPDDVVVRLGSNLVRESLATRSEAAKQELERLREDHQEHPINYNWYYTETVKKRRQDRQNTEQSALLKRYGEQVLHAYNDQYPDQRLEEKKVRSAFKKVGLETEEKDMQKYSCTEVLDCVDAIYKVQLKTWPW